jgi:hypothetical protein
VGALDIEVDLHALADVQSAIRFHIETFGQDALEEESSLLEAFITEARVNV